MDIRETRRERLLMLIQDQKGPGKQRALAKAIGKAPAQISQWVNRTRTITEETARQIEIRGKKPPGWMDLDPQMPGTTGNYAGLIGPAAREAEPPTAPPPPAPPRDFKDRRFVSASDWALLQDVKTGATPDELATIRERAAMIQRMVSERLAAVAACDKPQAPRPTQKKQRS